jgi:hypothetical protein
MKKHLILFSILIATSSMAAKRDLMNNDEQLFDQLYQMIDGKQINLGDKPVPSPVDTGMMGGVNPMPMPTPGIEIIEPDNSLTQPIPGNFTGNSPELTAPDNINRIDDDSRINAKVEARLRKQQEKEAKAKAAEAKKIAEQKPPRDIAPLEIGNYSVKSLIYSDANDWTVWINGKQYDNSDFKTKEFAIGGVNEDKLAIIISVPSLRDFDYHLKEKGFVSFKNPMWPAVSKDGKVHANFKQGMLRVSLAPRETFIGNNFAVIDSYTKFPNVPKNIIHKSKLVKKDAMGMNPNAIAGQNNYPPQQQMQQQGMPMYTPEPVPQSFDPQS